MQKYFPHHSNWPLNMIKKTGVMEVTMNVPQRRIHFDQETISLVDRINDPDSFDAKSSIERLKDLNRFISLMIHQTRNFCMSAKGYVSLLECEENSEKSKEWLSKITRGMDRLEEFLNEFERYRLSTNPKREEINVKNIVREVWGKLENKLNKDIGMYLDIDERAVVVGDKVDFMKMVMHLIKNSIEAIDGEGKISITLSLLDDHWENGGGWSIEFQDDGVGMNDSELLGAFRMYSTTKREHVGCGLNMATAVANRMGGEVEVKSKKGVGTVVRIKKLG